MKRSSLRFAALMAAMTMTVMAFAQQSDSLSTDTTMWFNQTHELSGPLEVSRLWCWCEAEGAYVNISVWM